MKRIDLEEERRFRVTNSKDKKKSPSRRNVLQTFGAGAAAAALTGLSLPGSAAALPRGFRSRVFPNYYPKRRHWDDEDLNGRVALITGASRGIGLAVGLALQAEGVSVLGTSREPQAHPNHPFPLLPLDLEDQTSINTFLGIALTRPEITSNGGLDILINNAGRFSFGTILPVSPTAAPLFFDAVQRSMAVLYGGHVAVTSGLFESVAAKAATGYGRILFTASVVAYAVGGAVPGYSYFQTYLSGKRAVLAYGNSLREFSETAGLGVKVSCVCPYGIRTALAEGTNPIFTQPVDANGNSVGDPFFQQFLDFTRQSLVDAIPTDFAAEAYRQLLTDATPEPNVAISSRREPYFTQGNTELINDAGEAENLQSAFPMGCRW